MSAHSSNFGTFAWTHLIILKLYQNIRAENGRNYAHGLICIIFVNSEFRFEIFDNKKFLVSSIVFKFLKFWQILKFQMAILAPEIDQGQPSRFYWNWFGRVPILKGYLFAKVIWVSLKLAQGQLHLSTLF